MEVISGCEQIGDWPPTHDLSCHHCLFSNMLVLLSTCSQLQLPTNLTWHDLNLWSGRCASVSTVVNSPSVQGISDLITMSFCLQAVDNSPAADKLQGTVLTARADPNDPALHGLTNEPSGHSLGGTPGSRSVSPRGPPSFTRGTSFSSTHGSPVSRSALEQSHSFTRHVASGKDRSDHEGVELGTIRSGSQNLGEELLEQQLHSFAPTSSAERQGAGYAGAASHATASAAAPGTDTHQASAAQQMPAAGSDGNFSSSGDAHPSSAAQHQPVSFQSLAALASSQAAANPRQTSEPSGVSSPADAPTGTLAADDHIAPEKQAKPQSPFKAASHQGSDTTSLHQGSLAQVATGRPVAADSIITGGQDKAYGEAGAFGQSRPSANPPAVLGRARSEKKWAYPMPTGSPMFEKVRSRNYDQEGTPPSGANSWQAAPAAVGDGGHAGEVSEQQPAQAIRSMLKLA